MAVGDTAPYVEPAESIFDHVRDLLASADFRFAQVERTFSDQGTFRSDSFGPNTRVAPHLAEAYRVGGFDVVSLASNHSLDWGEEAFLDTVDTFRGLGMQTIGAGRTIAEARQPALLRRDDVTIAVLGYCSVLLPGYWATDERVGVAPMRAETFYLPHEYQPGTPPQVRTIPIADDLDALVDDVRRAKEVADFVVVSCHWGVHFAPRTVPDYEREVARAAAAAGCDVIVGHGPHMLRGVAVVDGMPCLHSIGNFVMSRPPHHRSVAAPTGQFTLSEIYTMEVTPSFTYRHNQWHHLGVVAWLEFTKGRPVEVTLLPTATDEHPHATMLAPGAPEFDEVVEFVRWQSVPLGGEPHLELVDGGLRVSR